MQIESGQLYKHYKGNLYRIVILCKHSETGEELVVYQRQEDGKAFARPRVMFEENVVVDGNTLPRFEFIKNN